MWMWWVGAAFAGLPQVNLTWKAEDGRLWLRAAEGEHLAEDAPLDVDIQVGRRSVVLAGMGEDARGGVAIGEVRGTSLHGTVTMSVCEDGGSRCRAVTVSIAGEASERRRGQLALETEPYAGDVSLEHEAGFPAQVDANAVYTAAIAEAEQSDRPVLLDFGAVWCPPCNRMAAELLEVSPRPSVVDAFVVAVIDVDDPTSWTLKDRYHVGGYPTLVAITPQGRELGRQVGYESFDATVTWMDNVIAGRVLQPVDAPTPEVAAQLAWQAVRDGTRDDVADWMKIASVQPELVPYRMARFHLEPSAEDAAWLRVHAPGESLRWVLPGRRAAAEDEALRQAMLHAIRDDLTRVSALDAADLLAVSAELSEPSVAAIQYGAAAALVRGELSGDDDLDKGLLGWLAYLTEHAGDPEGAVQILQDARNTWPDEPTFHVSLVRSYQRQSRHEEALAVADRAVEVAWGDNLVNAARLRVISLVALGRVAEARAYVDDVLQRVPEPADGLDVRSHRMRKALRDAVPDAP